MRKVYSYYMTQRPPQIGAMPKEGLMRIVYINNDETRQWVETIQADAYARLEYDHELTQQQVNDYELIPEVYNVQMSRESILWIKQQLENADFVNEYESRKAFRLIRYLNSVLSMEE